MRLEKRHKQGNPLIMKTGERTLIVSSISPGNLAKVEQRAMIAAMLRDPKIRIAAIREKHIPRDLDYTHIGCVVITIAEIQKPIHPEQHQIRPIAGRVEIMINKDHEQHISSIERRGHRILKITLRGGK